MAKRKSSSKTKKNSGSSPPTKPKNASQSDDLAARRRAIDKLDRALLSAVNERAAAAAEMGRAKQAAGKPVYDPAREREILDRLVAANGGPLPEEAVRAIFREILSASRGLAAPIRVAYLGPEHSYSHVAAVHRFGQSAELAPVGAIAAVFEEVDGGQADYGLVPIENSTDGRIVDTLDMFARQPVSICGEVQLRIHHCLMGACQRSQIREIHSKPQAISQCRNWLARHMPEAALIETTSTAKAAQLAAEKSGVAAIASRQAAVAYGLDLLAENIEDRQHNVTRFAVIGNDEPAKTGDDKTSLMFELDHRAGALAEALSIFKRARLNLTWIESFPMRDSKNEYLFFVELEGHRRDLRVKRALASLEQKAVRVVVLGSYAKTEPID